MLWVQLGFIEDDELTVDDYQPWRCPECTTITIVRRDSTVDNLAGVLRMHRDQGCTAGTAVRSSR